MAYLNIRVLLFFLGLVLVLNIIQLALSSKRRLKVTYQDLQVDDQDNDSTQQYKSNESNLTKRYLTQQSEFSKLNETSQVIKSRKQTNKKYDDIYFRIIKGRNAELGDVPYQVALMVNISNEEYAAICGGSIIAPEKVLTAAHCMEEYLDNIEKLHIVAGQLLRIAFYGFQGQWRRVKTVMFPAEYNFPTSDISVILLDKPFVYNKAVQAIPYATKFEEYNLTCTASGYGMISKNYDYIEDNSPQLQIINLKINTVRRCSKTYKTNMNNFVCTSDQFGDVSKGDSGGPLVCSGTKDPAEGSKGVLVGIVCGGSSKQAMRTIFTRVSSYNNFINKKENIVSKTKQTGSSSPSDSVIFNNVIIGIICLLVLSIVIIIIIVVYRTAGDEIK